MREDLVRLHFCEKNYLQMDSVPTILSNGRQSTNKHIIKYFNIKTVFIIRLMMKKEAERF